MREPWKRHCQCPTILKWTAFLLLLGKMLPMLLVVAAMRTRRVLIQSAFPSFYWYWHGQLNKETYLFGYGPFLQWNLMATSTSIDPLAPTIFQYLRMILSFVMIQRSRTKKGRRYTTKLSIESLFVSGYLVVIEPEHISWQFQTNFYLSWCSCRTCCASVLQTASYHYKSVLGHCRGVHYHFVSTRHQERECHLCCMCNDSPTSDDIDCELGRLVIGKVLDVYWQFADIGNAYLGCCLCGFDPNLSSFSILPPHWTVDNRVEDPDMKDALQLMYGIILARHPTSITVLVWVLASVTYALDWLLATSGRYPGHPLSAVPLLQNPVLLVRLKDKVMIKPSNSLSKATGIPPCCIAKLDDFAPWALSNYLAKG